MSSNPPVAPTPLPAIPWYKSPVQVAQVVSLIAGLSMLFPKVAAQFGWTSNDAIQAWVESVFGAIGILITTGSVLANVIGIHFRARSKIQPLAFTQKGADEHPTAPVAPPKQGGYARVGLLALIAALAGCASLGLATPKGFDQQLAEAYGVHTAVVSATATALSAGSISEADAVAIQGMEQNARALLDAAHAAETAGNTAGASSNLALATTALTALQAYINSHGSK